MDIFADERDYSLLKQDEYTFFVLRRIIDGDCKLLLSDHERLIVCFSEEPYPVWIWTPDELSDSEKEQVYVILEENLLLDGNHRFNSKYNLADYIINRAHNDGKVLSKSTNMLAYDCHKLIIPTQKVDGRIHLCKDADIDELIEFITQFYNDIGIDQKNNKEYYVEAKYYINSGSVFFWKNESGKPVACCKYVPNGEMASLGLVYTPPEYRRKHYAENLVYQVTKIVLEKGLIPMLYTDADYTASNACYQKLGYVLQGKLCTFG